MPIHRRQERLQAVRFVSFLFQFGCNNQGIDNHPPQITWGTAIAPRAILRTIGEPGRLPGPPHMPVVRTLQLHQPPTLLR
jgi:hypothetical protein